MVSPRLAGSTSPALCHAALSTSRPADLPFPPLLNLAQPRPRFAMQLYQRRARLTCLFCPLLNLAQPLAAVAVAVADAGIGVVVFFAFFNINVILQKTVFSLFFSAPKAKSK